MSASPAIGIDLGTTRCCVGFLANSKYDVDIIENQHGDRTTPSYVAFTDNGEVVGKQAKDKVYRNPENVIYDSKRLIGRLFDDPYVQQNLKAWTFNVNAGSDRKPLIQVTQGDSVVSYSPHQISAKLLLHMKDIVENRIGQKVTRAVVTVPAYFNYHQRIATKEAGQLAGFETCKIMNEPTAAVLAYVHKYHVNDCKNVLVFDLGGGTFDVSIVTISGKDISVKATSGNTFLGGRDFDNNLAQYIMKKLKEVHQVDVSHIMATVRRIYARCENIKIELSFEESTQLDLHNILLNGREADLEITRTEFEVINDHLFKLCIQTVENCLRQASLFKADVEKILLVGGSTRIPKLRSMLSSYFGDQDKLCHGINPDEAVAYGATILAAGDEIHPVHSIKEITPLSLGIDVVGNRMSFIIHRNTPIPVTKTRSYITVSDEQKEMEINVYEGERSLVQYNTKIGTCIIELPPKPPGYQVQVTFHIDVNGILRVGASTDCGVYTNLSMEYEKVAEQKSSDVLKDALENKQSDQRKRDVISCLIKLKAYSINMKALCTYKPHIFTDEEKHAIIGASEAVTAWVNDTVIEDGTDEEKNAIVYKKMEIERVCEPILQNYGFNVSDVGISKFHKFLTDHDAILL